MFDIMLRFATNCGITDPGGGTVPDGDDVGVGGGSH